MQKIQKFLFKTPNKNHPTKTPTKPTKKPKPNHLVMPLMPLVLHLMQDSLAPVHVVCKIKSGAVCEADKLHKPEIALGEGEL